MLPCNEAESTSSHQGGCDVRLASSGEWEGARDANTVKDAPIHRLRISNVITHRKALQCGLLSASD
jgi:hypothetical protein